MSTISNRVTIATLLATIKTQTGIESVYSHYTGGHSLPYIAYIGSGQTQMLADGTTYWRCDTYQLELYFSKKDPDMEAAIEDLILAGGWHYEKSDDAYIEGEGIYLIYYDLT